MKELTKLVKLIFVPCKAEDLKPEHWLLLNTKKQTLHIPAAGGQYRRMIQYGYIPVKPYLVSNDEIKEKDWFLWANNGVEENGYTLEQAKKLSNTHVLNTNYKIQHKVIATPEQIFGSQIIMFNEGVKENFDEKAMGIILRMNGGACKIQTELENGKVVITI